MKLNCRLTALLLASIVATTSGAISSASAADTLPEFSKVSEGFEAVPVSDQQIDKGLFNVWKREKDGAVIGELPKNFKGKNYFIALTLSSGDRYAGLQSGDWVVQWRRYDDRLALIAPNLDVRATGDDESKASVKRLFTDRVLLDVPILAIGPQGGPVIDLDSLLVGNATKFFGAAIRITNSGLYSVESLKVFPANVELAFEVVGMGGRLQTLHYSFSEVPSATSGFKPRQADERVGYFTTSFSDLSKYEDEDTRVRFINRWQLEKRDPNLKLSPPKEPIRFYVEHTAPVRYRRWIKAGIDYWNKAFEKIGIVDAIVVEYQDAVSGIHMEKDPEDVRYNFVRWLNNDIGTAIGPSRVHPATGQILDADIILTDGWIRHFNFNYVDLMPKLAMEGVSAETLAWLGTRPNWDPRVRMGAPENSHALSAKYARQAAQPMAGYQMAQADPSLLGDDEFDGLIGHISQKNGMCMAANGRSMDLALARMNWALSLHADMEAEKKKKDKKKEKKEEEQEKAEAAKTDEAKSDDAKKDDDAEKKDEKSDDEAKDQNDESGEKKDADDEEKDEVAKEDEADLLDGMPEWFVGPLLADLVAHEVGHTLGLRHNFKASSLFTMDEINSENVKGKKPFTASVMDYTPINYRYEAGEIQGDYAMTDIGPYDFWAIEYGYTLKDASLPEILKRCSEPELQYATDEDTSGPDPYARRYDFGKDPLKYATEQMKLVELYRERLLDKFVKDGDSWAKARRGYELTLGLQMRSVSMMANWIGGAFVHRDKKGDPGNRVPVEVVPAKDQRDALQFVIETSFVDEAYGLKPEILERLGVDKWIDGNAMHGMSAEATWPIHDRVLDMQASALTLLLNPTTLRRVYDNELRLPEDQDALTLPELLAKVTDSVWTELDEACPDDRNDRKPMISSLRRNLQREHLQRLVDLILEDAPRTAAYHPISNLARMQLRTLGERMESTLSKCGEKMDAYSKAHLTESKERIARALEAGYTYGGKQQMSPIMMLLMGQQQQEDATK
ncbi:zinc-dependent metalloprotease [Neorhodopirellula pilleata]|uniref:Replication factor C large subunit n=1 Tax=Neorhodopirellula pilleata TaxID=2714738 RepID=A0A5C6ALF4_9BACT|nr:zinc-dependent metalloprotease [Neorhodopirellula pilleata]TWT99003.1 replication factor C large subunit [Neorhodopirellula pilleata]